MDESVIGIIFSPGHKEVLLVQRRDVPVWVLPGGGIEKGENPETALIREMFEETGYKVQILRTVGEYTPKNRLARVTYFFECKILSGEKRLSSETRNIDFFPMDNMPKLMPPPYPEWIAEAALDLSQPIHRRLDEVNYWALCKNILSHPLLCLRFFLAKLGLPFNT